MSEKQVFEKLQKVLMGFQDKSGDYLQYEQSSIDGEGLENVDIPFDADRYSPDTFNMVLFATDKQSEEFDDYAWIEYLANRETKDVDGNNECAKKRKEHLTLSDLDVDYFQYEKGSHFPKLIYEDVTERDLFGYPAISAVDLRAEGKGVWGGCGYRKIEIRLEGWEWAESSDMTVKVSLYWISMEKDALDNIFEDEIRYDKERKVFIAYVDTNRLESMITEGNAEKNDPKFTGRFEVHETRNSEKKKTVYGFPIQIVVKDTSLNEQNKNPFAKGHMVSIDFGTSATCAAIRGTGRNQLFTLSGEGKRNSNEGDNEYENPTNLMIYNWSEVFRQWDHNNRNCPFLITKSKAVDELRADYDSGYTVEDEYKSVDELNGRRKMQAIIMQLKMIPYRLADGYKTSFVSYDDESRTPVMLVDDVEREDGLHLDPIAFYGYLLGRAINNPINGALYTRYQVTYPAKFNRDVRNKIKTSLEYGLKRSLPLSIREAKNAAGRPLVTVAMDYSEPEACMGAVAGTQLKLDGEKAKLFAVYDLGGGTMDFAFGMYREPEGEEAEDNEQVLQFLGIDGDEKIGGEKLIHQLAYKIYCDNQEVVEEQEIKFVKPQGELDREGFAGLLSDIGDEIADTNLNILKEKLARPLFKHPSEINDDLLAVFAKNEVDAKDDGGNVVKVVIDPDDEIISNTEYRLKLRNRSNEQVDVTLSVKDIDKFLKGKIQDTVKVFNDVMNETFKRNADEIKTHGVEPNHRVEIFLGGHASRQHYVMETMKEMFKDANIHRVGEGQNDEGLSSKYAVNEKTAVAFGQLRLEEKGFLVIPPVADNSRPSFLFNVGYYDREENFVCVLGKNETDTHWRKANKVNKNSQMANLRYTTSPDNKRESMKAIEEDVSMLIDETTKKLTLYMRLEDERTVALALGTNAEAPEPDAANIRIRLTE